MPMKLLTLCFDKTHQTAPYTGVLTKQLENLEVCTGLLCKTKTHEVSPAWHAPDSPREPGHRPARQDHVWCQYGDTRGKQRAQEGGLVLLTTSLPPLPCWSTFCFSITASKLLSGSLLSPTSKCCLGISAVVISLLHVWPQVWLCYSQAKPQDAAAPLFIQRGGKLTWLHSHLNLQSSHH